PIVSPVDVVESYEEEEVDKSSIGSLHIISEDTETTLQVLGKGQSCQQASMPHQVHQALLISSQASASQRIPLGA
ncbi:hypothetical protein KUCAC02_002916, partial [Chaenocephalus aceratus]